MTKTLRLAAVALLSLALGNDAGAQTQKTITFGSASSGNPKAKKSHHRKDYGKNTLTVGLLSYLDGFTAVTYERMLTERFTVAVGAGVTYKNFWMQVGDMASSRNPGSESTNHMGDNQWDITDDYADFTYRRAGKGLYLSVCPKFYPNNESLDGGYVAPLIEYRNYRFQANAPVAGNFEQSYSPSLYDDNIPRSQDMVSENVSCLDVSVIWGGHYQLRGHIVIGYHVGLGFRNFKANRQDLGYEEVGDDTYRYTSNMVNYSGTRFLGNIGFSLGGWW